MTVASDVRLSPEALKLKNAAEKKRAEQLALLQQDFRETFATPHGKRTLRTIMDLAGYQKPSIIADPNTGDPLPYGTIYNEGRRNLYLSIRKLLRADILIEVENKDLGNDEDLFQ